jgi:protoporphyrinogen oxidase
MQEELGYIEGGTQTLIAALISAIEAQGGVIRLGTKVQQITAETGKVTGVVVDGVFYPHEAVIATIPAPLVPVMVPALPEAERARYAALQNIGVACLIFKLKRPVTRHFWVNVVDSRLPIPGFVEFSNLRNVAQTIVYVPYYMPLTHPKWQDTDEMLLREAFICLKEVNPALKDDDLIEARVGRLGHAQPICPPGFAARIPPVQTGIKGLQAADTCSYYPEDRGISESVRYGRLMAQSIAASLEGRRGAL